MNNWRKRNGLLYIALLSLLPASTFAQTTVYNDEYQCTVLLPDTPKAKISKVTIGQMNDQIVLTGKIERKNPNKYVPYGHVDVEILDEEGTRIMLSSAGFSRKRLHKRNRNSKHDIKPTYFQVVLDSAPPQNSVVKVSYHKGETNQVHNPEADHEHKDWPINFTY